MSATSYYEQVQSAAGLIRSRSTTVPATAVVLGSGLGGFASSLERAASIPYGDIPHWPASSVVGHEGRLVIGEVSGRSDRRAVGPGAFLRGARSADGDVRHARARRARREDADPDQRGGRHQYGFRAGRFDGDRRPYQPARQQPAGRVRTTSDLAFGFRT